LGEKPWGFLVQNPSGNDSALFKRIGCSSGDYMEVTFEGTDAGDPVQREWKGQFDGKDYPMTGDPAT